MAQIKYMNTFKPKIKCLLLGHTEAETTDSGYPYCKKCGAHSYYDNAQYVGQPNHWQNAGYLMRPIWWVKGLFYRVRKNIEYWHYVKFQKGRLPF